MSNLGNQFISASYQSVLNVGTGSGDYVTSTLKRITDGYGTAVPIRVSTTGVELSGSISLTGSLVSSIIPAVSNSIDLGSPTKPFRHLYVGSGSVYLDDHQVLSLNVDGTDTTLAAPTSGSLNFVNDIVFKSNEGLGTDSGGKFTMAGGGPNDSTQTVYSGSQHLVQVDGQLVYNNYVTDQAGNPVPGITGSIAFDIADSTIATYLENGQNFTIGDQQSNILTQLYGDEGQTGHTIDQEIWTTNPTSSTVRVSRITQDESGVQMTINDTAQPVSSSTIAVSVGAANITANYVTAQGLDRVTIQYGSGSNPAHFNNNQINFIGNTKFVNNVDVTGSLKVNGGITGSLQGNATSASQAVNASTADVATTALNSNLLQGTGSGTFATTGSNVFKSGQTISGSLDVTGTITATSASITYLQTIYQTSSVIFTSGSNILGDEASDVQTLFGTVRLPNGPLSITGSATASAGFFGDLQGTASFASNALSASQAQNAVSASQAQNAISASQSVNSDNAVSASQAQNANLLNGTGSAVFATTGSNVFVGNQTITGSLNVSGSANFVGDVSLNFIEPNNFKQNLVFVSPLNATTSSAILNNYLNAITTSLDNDDVNFALPPAVVASPGGGLGGATGSYFISGSNNIIASLASYTPASQGRRNILGSLNLALPGAASVNTSSLTIPQVNGNILIGNVNFTLISGSNQGNAAHQANSNINIGGININHVSASTAAGTTTAVSSNININTLNSNASGSVLTGSISVQQNINVGTMNLNHISSSINYTSNILAAGGTNNINNRYFNTGSNNAVAVSANIFGGQGTTINVAGSPSTNVTRTLVGNLIGGQNVTASLEASGTDLGGLRNSLVWGNQLIVSGSNSAADPNQSSVFAGRFNGEDNGLADSRRTILAVGTGTSAANRRTGFYITSGSLVGVSGSLDVKGGDIWLSGSLYVTGAAQMLVNALNVGVSAGDEGGEILLAKAATNTTLTGSGVTVDVYRDRLRIFEQAGTNRGGYFAINEMEASAGSKIGPLNFGQFQNNSTLSGSANVSQSMVYDVTDFGKGVSLVSGSRLTVADTGYYNIQFSAQLKQTGGGSANAYVWFKKNGSNVAESATRYTLANNTYQVAALNFGTQLNANDYIEIAWQSDDASTQLVYEAPSGNIPAVPSVIATIQQVR